ncbi:MAG: ABC transporter ATP-binding protein [Clostridia bacterium]
MEAVVTDNLSKTYSGGKRAVNHLTLTLDPGEIFGFLGPNGAGKTTTIKLLNGILTPSGGSCRVFGIDPARNPEKSHALSGVVTEHAQMYDTLTGLENLQFYASVFGVREEEGKKRAEVLLEQLNLSDAKNRKLAAYSTGMRQRLSLARVLLHQPKILFLDEPASGLDPESAQNVNRLIGSLAKDQGVTIFLCTHQLRYAQEICTRFGLMDEGELLADGTFAQLCDRVIADRKVQIKASKIPEKLPHKKTGGQEFEVTISSEDEIPHIVREIVENGGDVYYVAAQQPSLEDVYFSLTAKRKETKT